MSELKMYMYCEENDIIYELGEHDLYYPIIFVVAAEKNCSGSVKARTKLEHMKEHDLAYYVELVEQEKLDEYIGQYLLQLEKRTNQLLSQMAEQDDMGRMMAAEIARYSLL